MPATLEGGAMVRSWLKVEWMTPGEREETGDRRLSFAPVHHPSTHTENSQSKVDHRSQIRNEILLPIVLDFSTTWPYSIPTPTYRYVPTRDKEGLKSIKNSIRS